MRNPNTFFLAAFILFSNSLSGQISYMNEKIITEYGTAPSFEPFFSADIDRDGYMDVVLQKQKAISFRKNIGGLTLAPEKPIYSSNFEILVLSNFINLNDDNLLDFVMVSQDSMHLMLSNGGEYLKSKSVKSQYNSLFYGRKLRFQDIDNDGDLELLWLVPNELLVNHNWKNDLLDFKPLVTSPLSPVEEMLSFEVFTINNKPSLIVSGSRNNYFYTTVNNELILKLTKASPFMTTWDTGDVNSDGFTDILVKTPSLNPYILLYNNSTSGFIEKEIADVNIEAPVLIDIDSNGKFDLLYRKMGQIYYRLNPGSGTFLTELPFSSQSPGQGVTKNIKLDFNNDGKTDLIHGGNGIFNLILIKSPNDKKIFEEWYLPTFVDVECSDLDNDGFGDIVGINCVGSIEILWGDATNSFKDRLSLKAPFGAQKGIISDVNNDGKKDILFYTGMNYSTHYLYLIKGIGNRQFDASKLWKNIGGQSDFVPIDSDKDGKEEILQFEVNGNSIYRYYPGNIDVAEIDNSPKSKIITSNPISQLSSMDVNKDGFSDVIFASRPSKKVGLLLNNKSGGFSESSLTLAFEPFAVGSCDYNSDLWDDLLVLVKTEDEKYRLEVYINNKLNGLVYQTGTDVYNLFEPNTIHVKDFDRDQDNDLMLGDYDFQKSFFMEKTATQGFVVPVNGHILSNHQGARTIADIGNDGFADLINVQFYGEITINYNNSVVEPGLSAFSVVYDTISYNSAKVIVKNSTTTGVYAIIKESQSSSSKPVDGIFYPPNSSYGMGSKTADDAFVIHSGTDTVFDVHNLKSNTSYHLNVFAFNSNFPDNYFINYANASVTSTFTTKKALFPLKEFADTIRVNEDSILVIELPEFFNDLGNNIYSVENKNDSVSIIVQGKKLTIKPDRDFFGFDSVRVTASLPTETLALGFKLEILPIDDPTVIEEIENVEIIPDEIGQQNELSIEIQDPDTKKTDLRIEASSSNQSVISNSDIEVEIVGEELIISYTSSGYGITVITIKITDKDGKETIQSFNLEVSKILGISDLEEMPLVYPNPTNYYFLISDNEISGQVRVLSMEGKVVRQYHSKVVNAEYDIRTLAPGLYLVVYETKREGKKCYKLTKDNL